MKIDLTMDYQWGSCGKGGVTGYMAMRNKYDTVVCSYGTQAGHSYNNREHGIGMMVQQIPVGIISPSVRNVMIGPGALIHAETLIGEIEKYDRFLDGKRLMIHEHAAVVTDEHAARERERGQTRMGSTAKGVGQAAIDRILRDPDSKAVAKSGFRGTPLEQYVVDRFEYNHEMGGAENVLIEGAQGFSLSIYHGDWPYCTSRDVTPWQIAADCAIPWQWADRIRVIGLIRSHPIRVNNRDGSSGPAYPGQKELTWEEVERAPELTTVTKLPRRIFNFSEMQLGHAAWHCGGKGHEIAVTFGDYCKTFGDFVRLLAAADKFGRVTYAVFGPDDSDVICLHGRSYGDFMLACNHKYMERKNAK